MAHAMGKNVDMIRAQKFGFWVRTKQAPYRAVRWEVQRHEDGRESLRGRGWVEVLAHGEDREPQRFFAADVELAGPHEWLSYYPAASEPICGWGRPRLPEGDTQFCPRQRENAADGQLEPFCRRHMTELLGSAGEESNATGEAGSHAQ